MSTFSDYFSSTAAGYAAFRPSYPPELMAWLSEQTAHHRRAWDCGTGSGQAAVGLAEYFECVLATDPSVPQLQNARHHPRVELAAMSAEAAALRGASFDLVTVAQAIHWFDLAAFYDEVKRVLAPDGLLAVWSYGLLRVNPEIDAVLHAFHMDELGQYWPPERALVNRGYADLPFPFAEVAVAPFEMRADWTSAQLAGYLETWSAVTRFRKANGFSPVKRVMDTIRPLWDQKSGNMGVTWPITIRVGR
ncbi:MAG: class I SAM-dependent methyltransferase [bacterium]